MEPRKDEDYAKSSIIKYFEQQGINIKIVRGEDPPDYYVIINDNKILMEVTRASSKICDNEYLLTRKNVDSSLCDLCDILNDELSNKVPMNKKLFIQLQGPISKKKYKDYKYGIKKKLEEMLDNEEGINSITRDEISFTIEEEPVKVIILEGVPNDKKIVGSSSIKRKNSILNIDMHAEILLRNIITEKEKKMSKVNFKGEKWLVILNEYPLADINTYKTAKVRLNVEHTFNKIFLVDTEPESIVEI